MPKQPLNDVQKVLISAVAEKEGFAEFEIHAESGSEKGDNYLGIITTVTITSGDRRLDLVLKTSHSNEQFRDTLKISNIYNREIYVYEKIFPALDQLQKEIDIPHSFHAYATILGAHVGPSIECLVMDDIRQKNYELWDRKVPMNPEHITAVVKEYAKLHSLGFILKNRKPEAFQDFADNMGDVFLEKNHNDQPFAKIEEFTRSLMDKALEIAESNKKAIDVLQPYVSKLADYYRIDTLKPEFKLVITHGDCWCNNMMFKYKDPENKTKPDEICFLDWQLSKVGSPAVDLVYYLFTSADVEELRNYRHYLKIYYQTLSENLISVGLDPEEIFPFSMLEDHFKQFSLFGLMTAVMILQLIILDKEEAPDLSKMDDDFKEMFNMVGTNQQVYRDRILNLILFLADNELL